MQLPEHVLDRAQVELALTGGMLMSVSHNWFSVGSELMLH